MVLGGIPLKWTGFRFLRQGYGGLPLIARRTFRLPVDSESPRLRQETGKGSISHQPPLGSNPQLGTSTLNKTRIA